MTRDEYVRQCQSLIDAFDEHVTAEDVVHALRTMADVIETDGLDE